MTYEEILAHQGHHFTVECRSHQGVAVLVCTTCDQDLLVFGCDEAFTVNAEDLTVTTSQPSDLVSLLRSLCRWRGESEVLDGLIEVLGPEPFERMVTGRGAGLSPWVATFVQRMQQVAERLYGDSVDVKIPITELYQRTAAAQTHARYAVIVGDNRQAFRMLAESAVYLMLVANQLEENDEPGNSD